jgi:hypothetical protein
MVLSMMFRTGICEATVPDAARGKRGRLPNTP